MKRFAFRGKEENNLTHSQPHSTLFFQPFYYSLQIQNNLIFKYLNFCFMYSKKNIKHPFKFQHLHLRLCIPILVTFYVQNKVYRDMLNCNFWEDEMDAPQDQSHCFWCKTAVCHNSVFSFFFFLLFLYVEACMLTVKSATNRKKSD